MFQSLAKALPRTDEIALDWRLLLYTLASAVVATLLFALTPALIASRRSISSTLAAQGRTQVSARAPLQWSLVGVQVALAVTLLTGAGLLLRSFQEMGRVLPGFEAGHVLILRVSGNYGETGNAEQLYRRMQRTLDTLRAAPGVESAAMTVTVPGASDSYPMEMVPADLSNTPGRRIAADTKVVYGDYFGTLRIPLMSGSGCPEGKLWTTALVNRKFAETYFSGEQLLGHHLAITPNPFHQPPAEIVGIVGDARENGVNQEPAPTVYWCSTNGTPDPYFLIRTRGEPAALAAELRRKIREIEPGRSVFEVMPLQQRLFESTAENRFRTLLLSLFALTAISLAAIGLYGTLSYLISLRSREIGLRVALGALPAQIRWRFLTQGVGIALCGCLAGLAAASALSSLLAGMLYGVSRVDAITYGGVAVGVLLVAGLASALPAQRAARLDPLTALRHD